MDTTLETVTATAVDGQDFPAAPAGRHFTYTLQWIEMFVGFSGCIGNGLVLFASCYHKPLRKCIFAPLLSNQSLIDLLTGALVVTSKIMSICLENKVFENNAFKNFVCMLTGSMVTYNPLFYASTLNLLVFTIERFVKVVCHKVYQDIVTPMRVRVAVGFIWLVPLFTSISDILAWDFSGHWCNPYTNYPTKNYEAGQGIFQLVLYGFFAVLIITYCNVHMFIHVRRHFRRIQGKTIKQHLSLGQLNLVKTFVIVSAFFICCWIPMQILQTARRVKLLSWQQSKDATYILYFFQYINSATTPFIYAVKYQKFHDAMRSIHKRLCRGKAVSPEEMTDTRSTHYPTERPTSHKTIDLSK